MKLHIAQWVAVAALAVQGLVPTTQAQAQAYPDKPVLFLAQSAPGSGFDTITRAAAAALAQDKLITVAMPVTNMPSSAVGMNTLVQRHKGDAYMVSFQSISGHMNWASGASEYSYKDSTPIARIASDYYGVFVRTDSPMKTLKDFLDPLKADPKAFPIVGGRSDDRVFYGLMFEKAGIDPTQINYVAYAGGGESIAALLEGTPKAMITTVGEAVGALRSNQIRLLAFSAAKRPATGDLSKVPTLREAGLDFDWQNFRYAMGGPDMPKDAVKFWQDTFAKMSKSPAWKQKLEQYNWSDEYMVDGLDAYLAETQDAVLVGLRRLGMAKR